MRCMANLEACVIDSLPNDIAHLPGRRAGLHQWLSRPTPPDMWLAKEIGCHGTSVGANRFRKPIGTARRRASLARSASAGPDSDAVAEPADPATTARSEWDRADSYHCLPDREASASLSPSARRASAEAPAGSPIMARARPRRRRL